MVVAFVGVGSLSQPLRVMVRHCMISPGVKPLVQHGRVGNIGTSLKVIMARAEGGAGQASEPLDGEKRLSTSAAKTNRSLFKAIR